MDHSFHQKGPLLFAILCVLFLFSCEQPEASVKLDSSLEPPAYALVIHGGAGSVNRDNMSEEKEKMYTATLNEALDIGEGILRDGGNSLDAVEAVIRYLENDTLFNAGRGAVFTHEGFNSLDASIMDGNTMNAGAVAGVRLVKSPIALARAVMEDSDHVLLSGQGAETFARSINMEMVEPDYFKTQSRYRTLQRVLQREMDDSSIDRTPDEDQKYGTVGAVALDSEGHLAAGTSTGGMTNKRWDRIGDSPIIGAGTYASDDVGGVSCTGHGEFFIRYAVAYDLIAKIKYAGMPLQKAAETIIHEELTKVNAGGGLIALDRQGNISMEFNTNGMFRGYVKPGEREVSMFK